MTAAPFDYRDDALHVENVPLADIAARFGTPSYVYSLSSLRGAYRAYAEALAPDRGRVCYAVKANGNLAVLQQLAALGAGFDIVSGGELARVLRAGGDPASVVYSGVGKTSEEMREALAAGVGCFNVESIPELLTLDAVAAGLGRQAPVALRVNPDISAETHPYIATGLAEHKFGIPIGESEPVFELAAGLEHIALEGATCHIGSQIFDLDAFVSASKTMATLGARLAERNMAPKHIDLGGGLAIGYGEAANPDISAYVKAILAPHADAPWQIHLEPGRSIVGAAGCLLTRLLYVKPGRSRAFAVVDAAMNDLLRPALYDAVQPIVNVHRREPRQPCDVVGPVCETGDFLGRDRELNLAPNALIAVMDAGAYSFAMSSQYNGRTRAAEVLVDGDTAHLVRERESRDDLYRHERLLPPA